MYEDKSVTIHHKNILATLMFNKVKHNLCPSFIQDIFQLHENVHNTRMGLHQSTGNIDHL